MGNKSSKKRKIGLALGGGAARGLSHIGVLKALMEERISVDIVTGCSIGSVIGACYARNGNIKEIEEIVLKTDWKRIIQLADLNLALLLRGFIQGERVKELLKSVIGDIKFSDLKIPFAVVATDINTGEEVVIKKGSVIEAIRASISMPIVFTPVAIENRFLIDGIIVNPVPVDIARQMGADFVIACNVIPTPADIARIYRARTPGIDIKGKVFKAMTSGINGKDFLRLDSLITSLVQRNKRDILSIRRYTKGLNRRASKISKGLDVAAPRIFNVLTQSIYIMQYEIIKKKLSEADTVVSPMVANIATFDFHRGQEAITEGYKAAKNTLKSMSNLVQ